MASIESQLKEVSATLETTARNDLTLHTTTENKIGTSEALSAAQNDGKTTTMLCDDRHLLDVGWDGNEPHKSPPLVEGMSNEDVWIFLRRFNKVCVRPTLSFYNLGVLNHDDFSKYSISRRPRTLCLEASTSMYLRRKTSRPTNYAHNSRDYIWDW